MVFNKPVEKISHMVSQNVTGLAANAIKQGLSGVEQAAESVDGVAGFDGKVAHAVKSLTKELGDDLTFKRVPQAEVLEKTLRSFVGNLTSEIDDHAKQTGEDFKEHVLPPFKQVAKDTIDDLNLDVFPKV